MAITTPSLERVDRWGRAEKLLLAVLSGVIFLDALDGSLTQVALPSIGASLDLSGAQLQWIVSAYVLGYGGFLLLGGRCADVFGRRRVLVWGLVALIVASAIGTVVSDGTLLIAARFAKGASAAFTAPAALSILTTSFAEGEHRNRALGVYTAAAACGFTFGLVAGGLLTQLSWRWTFAVAIPVGVALLLAIRRVVPGDRSSAPVGRRLDVGGALSVTAAALLVVYAVVEAPTSGWLSAQTVVSLAVAAALLAAFVAIERTVAQPLVRLGMLRSAPLVRANLGALLLFGCATVFNVANTLYEQDVLGWSPLKTGMVFMVASISTGLLAPRAGAVATRIGANRVLLIGAIASLASYVLWLGTGTTTGYALIVASLVLQGAGFALAFPALNIQALGGVPDDEQGLASGLVGSSFQIGGALLLAVSTAATLAVTPAHPTAAQTVRGLHAGMWVAVVAAGLIGLIALAGLLTQRRRDQARKRCQALALERAA
jgi:MFS family permease